MCGGVRFEISEPLVTSGYCHCTRCQRRTGTAAAASARIAPGLADGRSRARSSSATGIRRTGSRRRSARRAAPRSGAGARTIRRSIVGAARRVRRRPGHPPERPHVRRVRGRVGAVAGRRPAALSGGKTRRKVGVVRPGRRATSATVLRRRIYVNLLGLVLAALLRRPVGAARSGSRSAARRRSGFCSSTLRRSASVAAAGGGQRLAVRADDEPRGAAAAGLRRRPPQRRRPDDSRLRQARVERPLVRDDPLLRAIRLEQGDHARAVCVRRLVRPLPAAWLRAADRARARDEQLRHRRPEHV